MRCARSLTTTQQTHRGMRETCINLSLILHFKVVSKTLFLIQNLLNVLLVSSEDTLDYLEDEENKTRVRLTQEIPVVKDIQ